MITKNKIVAFTIIMLIAAISEVSVTAYLVEKLGVINLVTVYIVTTAIGLLFVWINRSRKKEMLGTMKNTDWDSISNRMEKDPEDPRGVYYAKVGMLVGLFFWAIILIIIPGLVTDALGLVILFVWATSPTVRNFDPKYEPEL
jgi:UPF0716 family protein affecting phage T7 exclusion